MEFSVLIVFLVIFIMKSYIDKTYINDFLLVMGPYVFIVFINNVFMTKALGFYEIKKSVLEAVLFAECAYALGSFAASLVAKKYTVRVLEMQANKEIDDTCTLKLIVASKYTLFVCLVMFLKIVIILMQNSINVVMSNDFDMLKLRGITGHLFISLYALVPSLFYESTKLKYRLGIISSLLAIVVSFTTFVKYNVILMILAVGIYYIFKKRRLIKKVLVICAAGVIGMFLLNYIVIFFIQGGLVSGIMTFLKSHLWMYISSGVMMMNYIVGNSSLNYGLIDFVIQSLGAFPNMLLSPFTTMRITTTNSYSSVLSTMPLMSLSGERSNALSVLGTLFSSGNDKFAFAFAMIVWGLLTGYIMLKTRYKNFYKVSMVGVYFVAFNILSFFANYWLLSVSWEIILFSLLFERLFSLNGGVSIKCGSRTIL